MFSVFRETWIALRDFEYGHKIIKFDWKKIFGHWMAAVAWVFILWSVGMVAFWTYFAPQIPKLVVSKLPNIEVAIHQKKLIITPDKPLIWGDSQNVLIVDSSASADILNKYKSGLLVSEENIWYKSDTGTSKIAFPDKDYSISRSGLVNWIKLNKLKVWLVGSLVAIVFAIFGISSFVASQIFGLFIWSIIFLIGSKLLKKNLKYFEVLKICIYASVPGIFINGIGFGNSGMLGIMLPLVLFAWYSGMWIYKIKSV